MPLTAGSRLQHYEIVRPLGAGGMGEVWLAKDLQLHRSVALKLLPPDVTAEHTRVMRFEQEARAASALNHPNVCTIHALGRTDDGRHFIVMEYIDGHTLRERLSHGALDRREVLDIAIQIASALTAAHSAGVVHRDLKPENVMLRPDGLAKVLDFGIAKLVPAGADASVALTQTSLQTDAGTAVGTFSYMSPEQVRGQLVDARSDIWALGVVLYEMAAKRTPFSGQSTSQVFARILENDPAPLASLDPDVPPELQRIITKALQKDPERRYQVMKDLLLDLQVLRDDIFTTGRTLGERAAKEGVATQSRFDKRRMFAASIVLAVLGVVGLTWWLSYRARTTTALSTTSAPAPQPFFERPLAQVTFGSGLDTDVTWSPDSRFIAFASDRGGNFDIWVQPVDGGDAVQVTKSPAHDIQPDWSPDGSTIVFYSDRENGGLYSVPALGGPERQLASFGAYPKWSHDGSEIFVLRGALGSIGSPLRVFAVSATGGEPTPVRRDFLEEGDWWYWVASRPDGRISVLGKHGQLGFGLFTLSRSDGPPVISRLPDNFPLSFDQRGLTSARFQWNTAGTAVCFEILSSGVRNLWKAAVDPRTLAVQSVQRLTTGPSRDTGAAWSRDGKRLAYTAQAESARLWEYPFDPIAGRITGEGRAITEQGREVGASDLSVDGRYLAYTLTRAGATSSQLWLADLTAGTRKLVTQDRVPDTFALGALSADGKKLAYCLMRLDSKGAAERSLVMVRNVPGDERPISAWSTTSMFFPNAWTRDGRTLVGSLLPLRAQDPVVLALWSAATSNKDRPDRILVAEDGAQLWQAKISPDGRWLTFVVWRRARPERLEMIIAPFDVPGRDRWIRVATDHGWPDKPRWAPDGRTLYFISRRPGLHFNVWGIRFDPTAGRLIGDPFAVTKMESPSLFISPEVATAEMHLAGRRLVLTMQTTTGNIWMLGDVDR